MAADIWCFRIMGPNMQARPVIEKTKIHPPGGIARLPHPAPALPATQAVRPMPGSRDMYRYIFSGPWRKLCLSFQHQHNKTKTNR
ncbi:hypothetical protein [Paracoccus sp. SM22M-07]|uniref:hypothetical protein n=1 Tax=Paracoccus sp. SM22M-07 TaxID=1520813 RepID=UPI001114CDFD|nr:hypothetical protein [Paracoccus sp. SM22M-07]